MVQIANPIDNYHPVGTVAFMVARTVEPYLRTVARRHPVVVVLGPRQSGKTTLCRTVFDKP